MKVDGDAVLTNGSHEKQSKDLTENNFHYSAQGLRKLFLLTFVILIYCGVASDSIENFAQTTDYPLKFFGVIPQD